MASGDKTLTHLTPLQHRRLAVILIEDDPLQRRLLLECVRRADLCAAPLAFADAECALAHLHGEAEVSPPDLILLDRGLPGLDGEALLRRLRSDARTVFIPVILLSNAADPDAVAAAYGAGATCYIKKRSTIGETVAMMRCVGELFGEYATLPPRRQPSGLDQVASSGR